MNVGVRYMPMKFSGIDMLLIHAKKKGRNTIFPAPDSIFEEGKRRKE